MRLAIACALAALSGFVALSYEIVWIRTYAFLSWGRASSFGMLLGAYLAGLALGAQIARRYCGRVEARALRVLAVFLLAANVSGFLLIPAVAEMVRYVGAHWMLPVVAVVAASLGTGLPLIAHFAIPPEPGAGARLSYVYLANILGAASGSLLTGFVFLDVWPLRTLSVFLALLGLAMCAGLALLEGWTVRRRAAFLGAVAAGAVGVVLAASPLFSGVYERLLLKDAYRAGHRFETVIENRSGVIVVDEGGVIYGDGVYDGMFHIDPKRDVNGIVRPYALAALHEAPREVLMIGLGSGSWAQVIAHHPAVEKLTIVEINPGYLDLIAVSPVTASLLENEKVEWVVDDGRRWLSRTARTFDAIVQNTSYHWRSHTTNLLSREYLELCRRHLRDGGLMLYNTTWSPEAQRTGVAVFAHAWLFHNCMVVSDAPLVPDRARWRRVLSGYAIDGRPVFGAADAAALTRVVDDPSWVDRATLLERTERSRVITDDNMASEWGRGGKG